MSTRDRGGTRWSQLDAATQEHDLAAPGGFISHTGVAGLTLGGGMGWLSRKAGLSCDNLLSVEVVTEFEFQLHQVGPMVQLSLSFWDLDHGPQAFRAIREPVGCQKSA